MDEETRRTKTRRIQDGLRRRYEALGTLDQVNARCSCPATGCPLNGRCAACLAWHRDHALKPLPHCLREQDGVTFETRDSLRDPEGESA